MSFLLIEFNFCPREQRKSNCENNFHMFMLLSAEKLRNPHYYQIIQMKFFSLFYWHFLWVHALNQVYNSDKTFALNTGLWHGLFCWGHPIRKKYIGCSIFPIFLSNICKDTFEYLCMGQSIYECVSPYLLTDFIWQSSKSTCRMVKARGMRTLKKKKNWATQTFS